MLQTASRQFRHQDTVTVDRLLSDIASELRFFDQMQLERERPTSVSSGAKAASQRQLQRLHAWPSSISARWPWFREEVIKVSPAETLNERVWFLPGKLNEVPPDWTLRWLCKLCRPLNSESMALRQVWGLRALATRAVDDCSAAAVALHSTIARYAMSLRSGPSVYAYDDVVWNGRTEVGTRPLPTGLAERLIPMEIMGYFSVVLVHLVHSRSLDDVADIPKLAYCPHWRSERIGADHFVRIRARVNEHRVTRLFQRYKQQLVGSVSNQQLNASRN